MYDVILTSSFKKSIKLMKKRNKDFSKLIDIVDKLANDIDLDIKNKDHSLSNSARYYNCRECHIEPDWLLIYKKNNNDLILLLIETGSHSDLFN